MNMKIKIILVFLFISGVNHQLRAQGNKAYNDIVNKSENAIIKKDYEKALSYYSELNNQKYIFSRDIYNALLCANKAQNWEEVNHWGKLFLLKGAKPAFFEQSKFMEYRKTESWKQLLKLKIQNSINRQLVYSLDSLTSSDQNQFLKLKENPNTQVYNLTEEIDNKLFSLEKKYGKISEDNSGINIENDSVYNFRPKYAVLYRHSYQSHKPNSYFNVKAENNELERALYYNSMDYNLMPILDYQNKLYYLKPEMLPADIKDDFVNFQTITRVAYKNKNFESFAFYYPIFKFANFVDKESEKNFEIVLKQFYIQ